MAEVIGVAAGVTVEHHMLADVVTRQLEAMLTVGNYDAVKLLLEPVQPVDIAEAIGNPKSVRAVGAANGANPIPLVIPCHRVIARGGALQGYAGGLDLKARLLAMEQALPKQVEEQARLF